VLAAAAGAAGNFSAARGLLPDPSRACLVPPPAGCNGNGVQNLTACTCNCNSGYTNDLSVSIKHTASRQCCRFTALTVLHVIVHTLWCLRQQQQSVSGAVFQRLTCAQPV
jgi:hypothetical protein